MGQLKTSLSHLEYENEQLKRRTAKLEQENRSMENRLVQEQIDNGDLTARLDDARNLLRDRGLEPDVKLGSRRRGDGDDRPRTTTAHGRGHCQPAGRLASAASRRLLRSPARSMTCHPSRMTRIERPRRASAGMPRPTGPAGATDDDLDHHSFHTSPLRWLPVADATDDSTTQIR